MRLVTFKLRGKPRLGALVDGEVFDLRRYGRLPSGAGIGKLPARMADYLAGGQQAQAAVASVLDHFQAEMASGATAGETRRFLRRSRVLLPLDKVKLLPPVPQPGKIICVAMNYPAAGQSEAPQYPPLFLKPASGLAGCGQAVRIPPVAQDVAFEAELALVIGRTARRVPEAQALSYLAGYTLANDLGDRRLEKRTSQWTTGKLMDTFCPLGPALATPDEVPEPDNLEIRTWVNDRLVQSGNTGQMYFSTTALVSYLSELTTLQPGDLILTGSPKRLGDQPAPLLSLQPGDRVALEIGHLGRLENPIEAERDYS